MRQTIFLFLLGLAALAPVLAAEREASQRPNILLAIADDWGLHASSYETAGLATPTFDRLAERGVRFDRAFVNAPTCTASRGNVLTGQEIWRLGPGANLHSTLLEEIPVYTDLLEESGYFVGHTRKGWGPGKNAPGGRDRNPAGPQFSDFDEFLEDRPEGTPFCFWFGTTDPHRPFGDDLRAEEGIDPAAVEVPPELPDSEAVRRDIANYYAEVQRFDREVRELLDRLEEIGELENTIVVVTSDHGWPFPRAKSNLYDTGTHIPLVVSWPGGAEGERVVDDFVSLSDLAPTFLEAAGVAAPQEMTGRSLVELLSSDRGGRVGAFRSHVILAKERHHGLCRPDNQGYPSRAIRTDQFLYIRNYEPDRWPAGNPDLSSSMGVFSDMDDGPAKQWMVDHASDPSVLPLFLAAFGKRPAEELYDLRTDPHQFENIAEQPEYEAVRAHLAATLDGELEALEDPRQIGGAEVFDTYPYHAGYGNERVEVSRAVREALGLEE